MLLSIVVPVYHVEDYIGQCLQALERLPQDEVELLLVDDCGLDGSTVIAQAYADAHANARLLYRACNGGLSAARNTGLDAAQGEYVYFLDSDDVADADELLALVRDAAAKRLDIAKARFVYFDDETGEERSGPAIPATEVIRGEVLLAQECDARVFEPMVWQCVYRRAFLRENGLRMADGLLFEDELFQAPALLAAKRAAAFERVILRYRQREGSIMGSLARSSRWCASYLEVCRRLRAVADALPDGAPRRVLRRRVGQIALSVGKNTAAYDLPPAVAREATDFLRANLAELAGYALHSGDAFVCAQGVLLRAAPALFLRLYRRAKG